MEQIIQAFGIDWRLISIQIFNFTLLAVLLWYFLYTPVLRVIKERQVKIEKGVKDAESARIALEEADAEKRVILTKAHSEAEAIEARAAEHAKEKSAQIIDSTESRVESMLKGAENEAETLKQKAVRESEAEIARLAILTAEKVLRNKNTKV